MQSVKLHGVVLRVVDYGESDRVVCLLTEERGKISAFARGARASRRRFGGALEPFTHLAAEARERRGAELLTLESVSVTRGFGAIRGDLARIACAGYACELARELVRDAEPHGALLALLLEYLDRLDSGPAHPAALRAYELSALQGAGLMPRLTGCVRCGRPPEGERSVRFEPAEGGVVCDACAAGAPSAGLLLTPAAIDAMIRLQEGGIGAGEVPMPAAVGTEVRGALSRFIEHHLGRRLSSRKFLDEVGPLLRD